MKRSLLPLLFVFTLSPAFAAEPLKFLLITGGCCHDYKAQKDILKEGLQKRAHCQVVQMHSDDSTTKPPLALLGNPDYAKGYDLVIHDECAADVKDAAIVEGVLKPHREGVPGLNLHCAMHSYRVGDHTKPQEAGTPGGIWFEYLGLQSSAHGPQKPIDITIGEAENPIVKGTAGWKTVNEELYNNIVVFPAAKVLWRGRQSPAKNDQDLGEVVAWTNLYMGKTRVFSTTIGHHNVTVADERYLDLVARGALWACDKLNDDGTAKTGYGAGGK